MKTRPQPREFEVNASDGGNARKEINVYALVAGVVSTYALPVFGNILTTRTFTSDVRLLSAVAEHALKFMFLLLPVPILAVIITRWENLPLTSAGWRMPSLSEIPSALGAFLACICLEVIQILFLSVLAIHYTNPAVSAWIEHAWSLPLWYRIVGVVGIALCEECGRGYVIERFATLSGSYVLGGLLALVGSMTMHATGWGLERVYTFLPGQIVLVALYLWRRNVGTCVIAHSLLDSTALVVAPLLVR